MLEHKFFGLSLTTWIVLVLIFVYFFWCRKEQELFTDKVDNKLKIYNFNTSWCGYSKDFQPIWDKFQKKNQNNSNVKIMDVKCDDDTQELCKQYDIPGYPSVIFHKGNEIVDYQGERTIEGMTEQMKKLL
jgi:thiol-disulfide isomerase/thioredoxin